MKNEVASMDEKLVLLSLKDRDNPEIENLFTQLKENNRVLYQFLYNTLRKDPLLGIRKDVLKYVAENAAQFNQDRRYMFNLAGIMCNIKILPEHIKWVDDFLKSKGNYETVDDFIIVFSQAVEKDIPLTQIKELFDKESDQLALYQKIACYQKVSDEEKNDSLNETNEIEAENTVENAVEEIEENNSIAEEKEGIISHGSDFAEMFHNIITVMSKKEEADDEIHSVDENFKQIVAKLQLATSELMAYASEVVHMMEGEKEKNERLNALLSIQQRALSGQQEKINELRIQNTHLRARIQSAEKSEMRREAINQKINELQNLTINNERKEEDYPLFYDDVRR